VLTITLLRLSTIRTHEATDALASSRKRARILSATVSRTAQCGFGSFAAEVEHPLSDHHPRPRAAVGMRWA
jgi:hypothetical protein